MEKIRLAADIGGTFTDLVLSSDAGRFATRKILSTPPDYWKAVVTGFLEMLREHRIHPSQVTEICHATTVATNAVLERTGLKCGLITTQGFRDVLELRRMRFPETYNLFWEKPKPLIERHLRLEVDERVGAQGQILRPLDPGQVLDTARTLLERGAASIAVCLINAPVNPQHERLIQDLLKEHFPELFVSLSCEVLPELREYERTSTTVLNAYLRPSVSVYLERMAAQLRAEGLTAPVYVMHSGGGMMSMDAAIQFPVHVLESGPAAGIMGAVHFLEELDGAQAAVTFDMGGTTAKAAMIEDGAPLKAAEFEIGAPISIASRVLKGGGYLVRVPAIDVAEVGAGGGSIAALDSGGALMVGPQSAGPDPGPACYGLGGDKPTVTDANLVLGFINADGLLAGQMPLDPKQSDQAMRLLSPDQSTGSAALADGIRRVAINTMARAVRSVSTERGRDVRQAVLIAFGGNGPLHAAHLASNLGMRRVLIPRAAGVFSALGLLYSDSERTFTQPFRADLLEVDFDELERAERQLADQAQALLAHERPGVQVSIRYFADLRYKGQSFELRVAFDRLAAAGAEPIRQAFEQDYCRSYGHSQPAGKVQIVNIGCIARAPVQRPMLSSADAPRKHLPLSRRVRYVETGDFVDTPVMVARSGLVRVTPGPLLIEEYDTTTVVPPGWQASLTPAGSILLERPEDGQ